MKIHRPIVMGVVTALKEIFSGRYADKVIQFHLKKNRAWGSRDRKFFAEAVYDMVRWKRLLEFKLGPENRNLWNLFALWFFGKYETLPEWEEFKNFNPKALMVEPDSFATLESIPDWLDEMGREELGEDWEATMIALNRPAKVVLRANRLKGDRGVLKETLNSEGIASNEVEIAADALELVERKNVFQTKAFKKGLFEVQDAVSQQIVPLLQVSPGMRVVDACAGAGGKSLHIASSMENRGKVIALDIHEHKLAELRQRASRNGVDIVETRAIESSKVIKRLKESADRVLLDVPCSGLGVLKRNPDSKWKMSPERILEIKETQNHILNNYSKILKSGGKLVYSTCSIFPSENSYVVESFLQDNSDWKLLDSRTWLPQDTGYDGFYAAVLARK